MLPISTAPSPVTSRTFTYSSGVGRRAMRRMRPYLPCPTVLRRPSNVVLHATRPVEESHVDSLAHDVDLRPRLPARARPRRGAPKIWGDLTPVTTSMTRIVLCIVGSTAAPQMMRAVGLIAFWTTSAAFWASLTVMSGPPVTLMSAPVAPAMSTLRSGELIASSTASSARFSLSDSPMPMRATPPPFMIVRRSLKSRLTRPGRVMISVIPRIARARTESATLNAVWIGRRGTSSRSRSLGIVMTVSIEPRRRSRPHIAFSGPDEPLRGERERADRDRERVAAVRVLRALGDDRQPSRCRSRRRARA